MLAAKCRALADRKREYRHYIGRAHKVAIHNSTFRIVIKVKSIKINLPGITKPLSGS